MGNYGRHSWKTYNLGVGGGLTQHVLWSLARTTWYSCQPKHILLVVGTNNLLFGESEADVAAGIAAIAGRLAAVHPVSELFILLPPPFGVDLRRADEEREALKTRLAAWYGHRLIDADTTLLAAGRLQNPNYQPYLVHFTALEYKLLISLVQAVLRRAS